MKTRLAFLRPHNCWTLAVGMLVAAAMVGGSLAQVAAAEPPTAEQVRFFETAIRPVLVEHCIKCHGPEKQWSQLRLDSREALLRGGEIGLAIVPGKPEKSRLMEAVRHLDKDLRMPPPDKGERLTDRQIGDLAKWIEMGAPYPTAAEVAGPRRRDPNHWAFHRSATPPLIPAVKNASWAQTAVDPFILAKLEAAGIEPAAPADKRTLLRRAAFDLTGLPPTPEEIDAFVADDRPDAFARVVERMLASPAYGERWGRHWLDVARYADSNGLDENICHGNGWRYRDWVVAAFNADKPYDHFVRQQLAGDLLPAADEAQRREQLIATGFLAIGPKVLAEVDETKMQMDIVDEQLDTAGRAFLGLTLGCARCHDHKFDPISAVDYYALAGIFKSTRTMEHFKKIARWHENPLPSAETRATQEEYDKLLAAKKAAVETFVAKANEQVRAEGAGKSLPENLETVYPEATKAELKKLRDDLAAAQKTPPALPSAMGVTEDKVADVPIHVRGSHLKLGEVAPRGVPGVIQGPDRPAMGAGGSGRRELAEWLIDPRHPLTARVIVNRVWRWHFGRGLVPTTDNFGLLGEKPSHPELLDYLAQRLIDDGWSLKSLHRTILLSATYQQSSIGRTTDIGRARLLPSPDGRASAIPPNGSAGASPSPDPENRLFGRFSVRRLEAEEARDAMLAASGELDAAMGGSLLNVKNREFFFDHTSKDKTDYTSRRRSLYLPIVRNHVYDFFQLLDYPDAAVSTGDRATTTVAPQALLWLNSDLVMQSAAGLAGRVLSESDPAARVRRAYQIAYGREPSEQEVQQARDYVAQVEQSLAASQPDAAKRSRRVWDIFCHTLLAANEFIYVR